MKIELRKKTGCLGEVDYFIDVNGIAKECVSTLEKAEALYEEYKAKAQEPTYETLKSEEI